MSLTYEPCPSVTSPANTERHTHHAATDPSFDVSHGSYDMTRKKIRHFQLLSFKHEHLVNINIVTAVKIP